MPESWRPAEADALQPAAGTASGPSARSPGNGAKGRGAGESPGAAATRVPFHRLFAFADSADVALMLLGALGAVANGAALPFMTVLFGNLIDAFGGALSVHDVVSRVSMVSLDFVYLAMASAVASFVRKFHLLRNAARH
jgi:ATP-binding cassette, subfamily B (MDR/TAP), member 1